MGLEAAGRAGRLGRGQDTSAAPGPPVLGPVALIPDLCFGPNSSQRSKFTSSSYYCLLFFLKKEMSLQPEIFEIGMTEYLRAALFWIRYLIFGSGRGKKNNELFPFNGAMLLRANEPRSRTQPRSAEIFSKLFVAIGKNLQLTFVAGRAGTHIPLSPLSCESIFVFLNKVSFVPVSTVSSQKQWPGCP